MQAEYPRPPMKLCTPDPSGSLQGTEPHRVEGGTQTPGLSHSSVLLFRNGKRKCSQVLFPEESRPRLCPYLVVGDRFLLSQWTASKKAAFQNLSVCLRDRDMHQLSPRETGEAAPGPLQERGSGVSCLLWMSF